MVVVAFFLDVFFPRKRSPLVWPGMDGWMDGWLVLAFFFYERASGVPPVHLLVFTEHVLLLLGDLEEEYVESKRHMQACRTRLFPQK